MFEEIYEGVYYCDEYQFYGLESITMEDIILMLENGELDNE